MTYPKTTQNSIPRNIWHCNKSNNKLDKTKFIEKLVYEEVVHEKRTKPVNNSRKGISLPSIRRTVKNGIRRWPYTPRQPDFTQIASPRCLGGSNPLPNTTGDVHMDPSAFLVLRKTNSNRCLLGTQRHSFSFISSFFSHECCQPYRTRPLKQFPRHNERNCSDQRVQKLIGTTFRGLHESQLEHKRERNSKDKGSIS